MCIGNADPARVQYRVIARKNAITAYRAFAFYWSDDGSKAIALKSVFADYKFRLTNSTLDDPALGTMNGFHAVASKSRASQIGSVWGIVKLWGKVAVEKGYNGHVVGYRATRIRIVQLLGCTWYNKAKLPAMKRKYERSAA